VGKLTYCAFFDKSTNFGTEVDQYIINKFGGGATAELPPGGRGGLFPKCTPADIYAITYVQYHRMNENYSIIVIQLIVIIIIIWLCYNI